MTDAELQKAAAVYVKIQYTPAVFTPEQLRFYQNGSLPPMTFQSFLDNKWRQHHGLETDRDNLRINLGKDISNGL